MRGRWRYYCYAIPLFRCPRRYRVFAPAPFTPLRSCVIIIAAAAIAATRRASTPAMRRRRGWRRTLRGVLRARSEGGCRKLCASAMPRRHFSRYAAFDVCPPPCSPPRPATPRRAYAMLLDSSRRSLRMPRCFLPLFRARCLPRYFMRCHARDAMLIRYIAADACQRCR